MDKWFVMQAKFVDKTEFGNFSKNYTALRDAKSPFMTDLHSQIISRPLFDEPVDQILMWCLKDQKQS